MNAGRNNFEVIRYEYYRDVNVQFEAFKAGEIDIRQREHRAQLGDRLRHPAGQATAASSGPRSRTSCRPACRASSSTLRRDIFKDRRVREAIAMMFDFEWTQQESVLRLLQAQRARSSAIPSSPRPACPRRPSSRYLEPLRGKIPDEVFTQEFKLARDRRHRQRPRAGAPGARAAQGGRLGDQGRQDDRARRARSSPSRCMLNDASFERVALPYKQNLERIGIDMNVRTVDTAQYQRREDEFDFDMIVDAVGPVAVAGQRAARVLGLQGGRHAGRPQHDRHQGRRRSTS